MFKKTITYTDYNGVTRTEDFYFNLTKAEVALMELSTPGGLQGYAKSLQDAHDNKKLVDIFVELIKASYGIKSADGRRFIKSDEITQEFVQTPAYSELIIELIGNAETAAAFFNGIAESVVATSKNDGEHKSLSLVE